MAQDEANHGVIIRGDSHGPVAAGHQPTALQVNNTSGVQLEEVLHRLRETRSWIEENRTRLDEADLALEEVDDITDLVQQSQPNRARVMAKVDRLVTRLSAVGGIAGGAWGLDQLISQFLR
ncbi:hypothetical protein ACIBBG_14220 [Micromonospora chersina]|uniref:hypothetical protein n=1 Tax=Micromonospora chersina TaxID=47854 RepID=UPI00379F5C9F